MVKNMKDNLNKIKLMDSVIFFIMMKRNTLAILLMMLNVVKGNLFAQMEEDLKEFGKMDF